MFNFNATGTTGFSAKVLNRMFRKIDGLNWDLQSGQVGVKTRDGSIATLIKTDTPAVAAVAASEGVAAVAAQAASTDYNITVNPFSFFATPIPAFATQVPFDRISEGDLIVGETEILGWVVAKTAKALKLLDFKGFQKTYQPPKVQILNQDGALVVQSLTGLFGGTAGLGGLQNSLLPLIMMSGGETEGLESILPLVLFGQLQTANPAAAADAATVGGAPQLAQNPIANLLPMLLLSKSKKSGGKSGGAFDGIDPMMLMMSGAFGGGAAAGGLNPMMLLALSKGGFGGGDDEPELVSIPKTNAAGGFVPALERITRR
jgi:hypothetical protein